MGHKITSLTSASSVASTDVLPVVADPSGTAVTKKATARKLVTGGAIGITDLTAASSVASTDQVAIIADPSGTATAKTATAAKVFAGGVTGTTALSAAASPASTDVIPGVADPSGTPAAAKYTIAAILATLTVDPTAQGLRLSLETGTSVTTTDQTSKSTLYFTPHKSGAIALYDGSKWVVRVTAEISLSLTLTSGKNYDVFAYWTGSVVALELSAAWTDDTTRADALTTQDGVAVKSGALTRRHVGTIRASGTDTTEDSISKRFVWNRDNQVPRKLKITDTTNSWTWATAGWQVARGQAGNAFGYVSGDAAAVLECRAYHFCDESTGGTSNGATGVGVDSTSANSADLYGAYAPPTASGVGHVSAFYSGYPGLGYHLISWLEYGSTNARFYGDNGASHLQSGMMGSIAA